jgi:type IV pilus biogenesis protein PilP
VPSFGVPSPDVLRQLTQQQSELALLELALKKAELQRKLEDLRAPAGPFVHGDPPTIAETVMPTVSDPTASAPMASAPMASAHRPVSTASQFAVRRIHRVRGQLAAELVCPDGDIRQVGKGAVLSPGLTVADIRADGVFVRRDQQDLIPLPSAAADGR